MSGNEVILQLLQIYGAVKILLVVTFGLLRGVCDRSYRLSYSWVPFAETLVNLNTSMDRLILPMKGKYIF